MSRIDEIEEEMRRGERDPGRAQPGRTLSNSDTIDHIDRSEDADVGDAADDPDDPGGSDVDLPFDSPLGFPEFDDIHPFNIEAGPSFDGYMGLRSSRPDVSSKVFPVEIERAYDPSDPSVLTFDIEAEVSQAEVRWVTTEIEETADIGRSEWNVDEEMSEAGQLNIGFEDLQLRNIGGEMHHSEVDVPVCPLPGVVKYLSSSPFNTTQGVVIDYLVEIEYQLRANDFYEHVKDVLAGDKLEEEAMT